MLTLADALPKLEHLVLSGNRLVFDVPSSSNVAFPLVTSLVLNQTNLTWTDVQRVCSAHFPQLRELYVASNELTDTDVCALTTLCRTLIGDVAVGGRDAPVASASRARGPFPEQVE